MEMQDQQLELDENHSLCNETVQDKYKKKKKNGLNIHSMKKNHLLDFSIQQLWGKTS